MADVTGPIPTLSGSLHKVPNGVMCDNHPERPATRRVQGETDSFGSEMIDLCSECYEQHKKEEAQFAAERAKGVCDWCKSYSETLRDKRDMEEGSCGRVYQVCKPCRDEYSKRLNEEYAAGLGEYDYLWD